MYLGTRNSVAGCNSLSSIQGQCSDPAPGRGRGFSNSCLVLCAGGLREFGGQPAQGSGSSKRGVWRAGDGAGVNLVSLLEHPWPSRVQWSVQPKAEQDSVPPGGHQPAVRGCS